MSEINSEDINYIRKIADAKRTRVKPAFVTQRFHFRSFQVLFEVYTAYCLELGDCGVQGATLHEIRQNAKAALKLSLERSGKFSVSLLKSQWTDPNRNNGFSLSCVIRKKPEAEGG